MSAAAAAAAATDSVRVEHKATSCKRCCDCGVNRPEFEFSGAQLKKKGKRVCGRCVEQRELEAAMEADAAAAAAAKAPPTAGLCSLCNKLSLSVRQCSRCRGQYCGAACLKIHGSGESGSPLCDIVRTQPPLTMADEDRLTRADVALHWPRIQQRIEQLLLSSPMTAALAVDAYSSSGFPDLSKITVHEMCAVVAVYPPNPALPWWRDTETGRRAARAMVRFGFNMLNSIRLLNEIFSIAAAGEQERRTTTEELVAGLIHMPASTMLPAVMDESRLFHRLLRYWIYYLRHVDPRMLQQDLRPFIDVQSDEQGVLPVRSDGSGRVDLLIAYCTHVDEAGGAILLPLPGGTNEAHALVRGGSKRMILSNGKIVEDAGLLCSTDTDHIAVHACTGRAAHPNDSYWDSPLAWAYGDESYCLGGPDSKETTRSAELVDCMRKEMEARKQPGYFHLAKAVQLALGDQWPQTKQSTFVATPKPNIETELAELLLLESLADEAAAGDAHSRLLIGHIEAECGTTIGEVIAEQRSRLERMMADQRDQLRIHAEVVERHDQRDRLKLKTAGNDISDGGGGSSGSSSHSASASSSIAQLGDSVGRLTPSSSATASSSEPSAALSRTSAPTSTGALSSDHGAVAVAATTAASSSAACSWTAAHRSLESLRAPGRKKYGAILKAALRFLHSLQPVSVNRGDGSHTVFHFARGGPVTLVQPHAGGRSKDGTVGGAYCTRLYNSLHAVALQQMQIGGGQSVATLGAALPSDDSSSSS